jgi:hypothetical protein
VVGAVLVLSIGTYHFLPLSKAKKAHVSDIAGASIPLSFKPAAPKDKPDLADLKKGETAYDSTRGTYSYADALLGNQLVVSQQAVPSKFSSPDEAVAAVAKSISATESLDTKKGQAYMKTDKSGAQVIVLSMKGLLILIQSPFRHAANDWIGYIDNLQ